MQFDRDAAGTLTPLPRPSIDTGMGLERIAAVLQGKLSNYDTDLIQPIIVQRGRSVRPDATARTPRVDTALRIAADHARATAFLIHDGVLPSNEGRGYVLRKIMRRAMRNVRMIGVRGAVPLQAHRLRGRADARGLSGNDGKRAARGARGEGRRASLRHHVPGGREGVSTRRCSTVTGHTIPGAVSFKLYDTYGLALDEQEDMARERGLAIDREGFDAEMEQQRERARASWKGAEKGAVVPAYQKLLEQGRTKFLGYSDLEATSRVIGLLVDSEPVDEIPAGARAELVFDQTPFYAETGGQVGDRGALYSDAGEKVADVETAFPGVPGLTVHRILAHAPIRIGDVLRAEVAAPLRDATRRNHTATHLLHASLRQVLGTHVKQAGSVVEPGRLRFDFTHYAAMDRRRNRGSGAADERARSSRTPRWRPTSCRSTRPSPPAPWRCSAKNTASRCAW